jgi:hypothetical protein
MASRTREQVAAYEAAAIRQAEPLTAADPRAALGLVFEIRRLRRSQPTAPLDHRVEKTRRMLAAAPGRADPALGLAAGELATDPLFDMMSVETKLEHLADAIKEPMRWA